MDEQQLVAVEDLVKFVVRRGFHYKSQVDLICLSRVPAPVTVPSFKLRRSHSWFSA